MERQHSKEHSNSAVVYLGDPIVDEILRLFHAMDRDEQVFALKAVEVIGHGNEEAKKVLAEAMNIRLTKAQWEATILKAYAIMQNAEEC